MDEGQGQVYEHKDIEDKAKNIDIKDESQIKILNIYTV